VYAYAEQKLRRVAWMKLFPGATAVWKVSEFEECELYRAFKRHGLLKTLGDPLRKDVVREKSREKNEKINEKANEKINKKRKAETEGRVQEASKQQCCVWRHELSGLRIRRLELEQEDPRHPELQAVDAAIRVREQQLERAAAGVGSDAPRGEAEEKWWTRHPPEIKRPCGHVRGSVLREC
jgi:hypothetical protein